MSDTIREFIVSYGFAVDDASRTRAESATKSAEDRIVAANAAAVAKRVAQENKAQSERIALAIKAGEQLSNADRRFVLEQEKNRRDAADRDAKAKDDAAKRDEARRNAEFKKSEAQVLRLAGLAIKTLAAVDAAKIIDRFTFGAFSKLEQVAGGFERLRYAAERSGSSVKTISAFSYAIQQLGGNADAAQASLDTFGSNLQKYKAFEDILKNMGIATRDANGQLRDSGVLIAEYLQKLRDMPRAQREAIAGNWGIDESTVQAGVRPELSSRIADYNRDQAAIGANADATGRSGVAFQQAYRHVVELIDTIKSRVEETLFRIVTPSLDAIADWLKNNGKVVTDAIDAVLKGAQALGAGLISAISNNGTFRDAMAAIGKAMEDAGHYLGSDQFRKDIKGFVSDIAAMARAIRHGLELLGILPTSPAEKAAAAGLSSQDASVFGNNQEVFGPAINRGRQEGARAEHGAQSYQDRVTGKLNAFKGGNGWWTPERQSHAVDYLMENAGLTETGAKALVSRWKNVESTRDGPASANASGHRGIAQWGRDRQDGMGDTFDEQLAHVEKELNGPEGKAKHYLNEFGMAATGASMFERGEGYDPKTGKDNFTDKTDAGIAGVVHGLPKPVAGDSPEVAAGRRYLAETATGAATTRDDSIAKLNPAFVLKAAEAVKQARAEGIQASIGSGYRSFGQTGSAYDAQGYSGHSYGLASDFSGIGAPGSTQAKRFDEITRGVGLGGYGPDNPREWNHKELGDHLQHDADRLKAMRGTLGPNGEMVDPQATWAASGYVVPKESGQTFPEVAKAAPAPLAARTLGGYIHASGGGPGQKPQGEPLKVEVTEGSAFKLGKAFASSSPLLQTGHGSGPNTLADIHARWEKWAEQNGTSLSHPGAPRVRPLGDTPQARASVSHVKGNTSVTHNPTFNIKTSDVRSGMDAARMVADRGNRDLLRNVVAMEA